MSRAPAGAPRLTKQERAYQAIRERILDGTYVPGYRVVIDTLAVEFGVSALPVREAIRRLEAEGLVVFRPNAGATVTPTEPGQFEDELTALAALEGFATALAAPHIRDVDITRLTAITDGMVEAMERLDPLSFGQLNQDFHGCIYERCPNVALVDLMHDVARRLDAMRRTVFVQIPYRGAASIAEHRKLIELFSSGAPAEEIEREARAHKLHTIESFRAWRAEGRGLRAQQGLPE
jgi:DNA-binding GntR family transcriptional regulator